MKWHREPDDRVLVNLDRGEDLRSGLEGLATRLGLVSARISAIGALEDPELGCWDPQARIYHKQIFPGIWELLCLNGNLSLLDGRVFMHAHATLSGEDFIARGGHLFEARVGVVVEAFLDPCPTPLPRRMCPEVGLPRWEPGS